MVLRLDYFIYKGYFGWQLMQFDGTCGLNDDNESVLVPWFWWFYSDYVEACQYSGSWDSISETYQMVQEEKNCKVLENISKFKIVSK